jgi:hypothetical protein
MKKIFDAGNLKIPLEKRRKRSHLEIGGGQWVSSFVFFNM